MNIVRCCSSRIPAYPWLGWVGPPLHFHLGLGQVNARGILSLFVGLRANEHWPQQQGTMTNRVRHLAKSARKRNVVLVEAFLPLLVSLGGAGRSRSPCLPYHHRTGRSWADPAPKHKG
ncbi:hypothetical protein L195_g058006 [Trifolium pratense]|uniref:Uncharacterized protein n=1 Tax=Trifolium pratense TaxID=57577 RepID=A0A2K3KXP4_TRIPR|nr:hypothetical protein L195_g058006 [Trifolium pratense]